jgi:hypothetical protein
LNTGEIVESNGQKVTNWSSWLITVVVVTGASYLPLGEFLTRISFGYGFSLNLIVSSFLLITILTICLAQHSYIAVVGTSILLVFILITGLRAGTDARHLQYAVPFAIFLAGTGIRLDLQTRIFMSRVFIVGALVALPLWVTIWLLTGESLPRASAPVVPLTVLVLLCFSEARGALTRLTALASVTGLLVLLAVTTARMAFAVSLIIVLIWLIIESGWSLPRRLLTGAVLLTSSALYWFGGSWQRERLFGRDNSLTIGPISLNGEGRTEAADILAAPGHDESIREFILGAGGGSSGQALVAANFHLDKPHNEFIRTFIDGGILLVMCLLATILIPTIIGILNYRRFRDRLCTLIPIFISLLLLGFAISDNALSYAWLMLPASLLVAWSHLEHPPSLRDFRLQIAHQSR